jgi:hypothetical protein
LVEKLMRFRDRLNMSTSQVWGWVFFIEMGKPGGETQLGGKIQPYL